MTTLLLIGQGYTATRFARTVHGRFTRIVGTRRKAGDDQVVGGVKGSGGWMLFARQRADGLSEAQLVTAGL